MTKLIAALDTSSLAEAEKLLDSTAEEVEWFKIGKQFYTRFGPEAVELVKSYNRKVFLDLKFHDIPNTVAGAVSAAADLGIDMLNVHAAGGEEMMRAASETARDSGIIVLAVTVLTSMNESELQKTGVRYSPKEQVVNLASLAETAEMNGVVCSAWEIEAIRSVCSSDFVLVVPGIRPEGSEHGDQKRVLTPSEAKEQGADFIVVGRPITKAENPAEAARNIKQMLL